MDVLGVKDFIVRSYSNETNSYLIVPIYYSGLTKYVNICYMSYIFKYFLIILDNMYNVDWNVVSINKFVETEVPTIEQRKSKFYEEYLKMPNIISPWYRNISPIQVII